MPTAPTVRVAQVGVSIALVALVAISALSWDGRRRAERDRPARELGELVLGATDRGGTYLVGRSGRFGLIFTGPALWALRSHDRAAVLAYGDGRDLTYEANGQICDGILVLSEVDDSVAEAAQTLGTVDTSQVEGVSPMMRVDLEQDQQPGGSC